MSEWPVSQRFELSPDPGDRNLDVTQFTRQGGCVRAGDQAHPARAAGCGASPGRGARLSAGLRTRFAPAPPTSHCCWPGSWGAGGCALRPGVSGPAVRSSDQAGKRSARRGSRATGPPICVRRPSVPARQVPTPGGRPWVLGSLLVVQRRNCGAKLGAPGAAEPCSHRHTCQQVARDSRRLNTDRMRWKQSRGRPVSL